MWVFTELGEFYSAVTDNQDERIMWVRSRDEYSANVLAEYADAEVVHMLDADYEWRVVIPRTVWVDFLVDRAERARGTNFKSTVSRNLGNTVGKPNGWVGVCHDVWQVLYDYQHKSRRGSVSSWEKKPKSKKRAGFWSDFDEWDQVEYLDAWDDVHEDAGWLEYQAWENSGKKSGCRKSKKR